jgi:hypothetical protein
VTTPIFKLELAAALALVLGELLPPELEHAVTIAAMAISENSPRSFPLIWLSLSIGIGVPG